MQTRNVTQKAGSLNCRPLWNNAFVLWDRNWLPLALRMTQTDTVGNGQQNFGGRDRDRKITATDLGVGEADTIHLAAAEVDTTQVGAAEVGVSEVGLGQINTAQIKPAQIAATQIAGRATGAGLIKPRNIVVPQHLVKRILADNRSCHNDSF